MGDHTISAVREKRVVDTLDYTGDRFTETDEEDVQEQSTEYFVCSCGDEFNSESDAETHLETTLVRVTGDDVMEVAERMRDDRPVTTGVRENGFIIRKGIRDHYFIGFDLQAAGDEGADNEYIVFELTGRTKTSHQNDPKLQTSQTYVVTGESYRVPLAVAPEESRDFADSLAEIIDHDGETMESGHVPPNRTMHLQDAVDETLSWYASL